MIDRATAVAPEGARRPLLYPRAVGGPLNVSDYETLAAARLDEGAYAYAAGGANDELTLRDNVESFGRWQLLPRVLRGAISPSAGTTVLGQDVSLPVLVAPVAYQRALHPDGELATAAGARDAGTIMCLSTFSTTTAADVAATGVARWFQLYPPRDRGLARELCAQAGALGFGALVITVDVPVSGRRERDLRTGWTVPAGLTVPVAGLGGLPPHEYVAQISPSVTWDDLGSFASDSGLPVLIKGILAVEDALLACDHGVAGIVVSNHGGRQLDGVPAAVDVLPEIVDAVEARLEVLVDGGVRRGTDVVKALALGARAVLAGRAPVWGLAAAGAEGVRGVLELLRAEVELALQLLGCEAPAEVTRGHVRRAPLP
jgi:4-hydroxymandelate oxidase